MKNLILVELTILVLLLAFLLERDDDEADKNVNHKEGDDDDVYEVEDCDSWTVVRHRAVVLSVRVNAAMHQSASSDKTNIISTLTLTVTTDYLRQL